MEGSWHVLPADAPVDVTRQQIRAARHLLTARLEDLAGKRFRPERISPEGVAAQLGQVMQQNRSKQRERLWIPVVAVERLLKRYSAAWDRHQVGRALRQHRLLRRCRPGY